MIKSPQIKKNYVNHIWGCIFFQNFPIKHFFLNFMHTFWLLSFYYMQKRYGITYIPFIYLSYSNSSVWFFYLDILFWWLCFDEFHMLDTSCSFFLLVTHCPDVQKYIIVVRNSSCGHHAPSTLRFVFLSSLYFSFPFLSPILSVPSFFLSISAYA